MSRQLCMSCWRLSALEDLWFSCPQCTTPEAGLPAWLVQPGAAGSAGDAGLQPLKATSGSLKTALLGGDDDGASEAKCPRHPDAEIGLYCRCGRPLLQRAEVARGRRPGLGFAGPRAAGKTLLILAMVRELRRAKLAGRTVALSGIGDTEQRFGDWLNDLFRDRKKPGASIIERSLEEDSAVPAALPWDAPTHSFCWEVMVEGERRRGGSSLLGIYDLAGETWGRPAHERLARFDRYLALLGSLVFVIDGAALAADLGLPANDAWDPEAAKRADGGAMDHQWLAAVIDRVGKRTRDIRLAVVISKADLIWGHEDWQHLRLAPPQEASDQEQQEHQERLATLLNDTGRRDLVITARSKFKDVRLFAASSLGFKPASEDVEEFCLKRKPEPLGVLAPLAWLLTESLPALAKGKP